MSEFGTALLNNVQRTWAAKMLNDAKIQEYARLAQKSPDYTVANDFAVRTGELLTEAINENTETLAFMSEEVASELLTPILTDEHNLITEVTKQVQANMNAANNIGLGVQVPDLDTNRIQGLIEKVSSYPTYDEARWVLNEPIINYSQAVVDQSVHKNAKAQAKAGIKAYIVRKAEAHQSKSTVRRIHGKPYHVRYEVPCKWCAALEGRYEYIGNGSNVPRDVYRRHEACRCTLTFEKGKQRQNVWDHGETWTVDDVEAQEDAVANAMQAQEARKIPDNSISQNIGADNYNSMYERVENVPENFRKVWDKYEDRINVGSTTQKGAYARGNNIYFNLETEISPVRKDEKPWQVFFHESHHAIDSMAYRDLGIGYGNTHFSAQYNNHIFPNTIVDEVQALVKERGAIAKELVKQGNIEELLNIGALTNNDYYWITNYGRELKYTKQMGYNMLQKEIRELPDSYRGDLSDILEGATNGKITCGYGHGKKYWTDRTYSGVRDGLATEAFAEMADSTYSNPESLETIQKYLPKSYDIFLEMIDVLAQ